MRENVAPSLLVMRGSNAARGVLGACVRCRWLAGVELAHRRVEEIEIGKGALGELLGIGRAGERIFLREVGELERVGDEAIEARGRRDRTSR